MWPKSVTPESDIGHPHDTSATSDVREGRNKGRTAVSPFPRIPRVPRQCSDPGYDSMKYCSGWVCPGVCTV
jgi:hypothetical protein